MSQPPIDSRTMFVDKDGRLTNYGLDILNRFQRFLGQTAETGAETGDDLTALQSQVDTLDTTVTNIDNELTVAEGNISSNTTLINTNTTNISSNLANIQTLENDYTTLEGRVTQNESDIASLESDVANNAIAISNNTLTISATNQIVNSLVTRTPQQVKVIRSVFDWGTIQPDVMYIIDGQIDMMNFTLTIPSTGINIMGLGFAVSKMYSSTSNYTMFDGDGDVFVAGFGITFSVTGTSSQMFDMVSISGLNAIEFNFVNFENCNSLGELSSYRQLLIRNVAFFGVGNGWTFNGTWLSGFKIGDFLVRNFGSSGTIFKEGTSFIMNGRFNMNANIDLPAGTSSVCDFTNSNFLLDSSFQLSGGLYTRSGGLNRDDAYYFPNVSQASNCSDWRNNTGLRSTRIGAEWTCTAEATTTITTAGTFVKLAGTTTPDREDHMTHPMSNRLMLTTTESQDLDLACVVSIEQAAGAGAEIEVMVRVWRDATSTWEDGSSTFGIIPNIPSKDNVLTLPLFERVELNMDDYVEVWVANLSGTEDLIMRTDSHLRLRTI